MAAKCTLAARVDSFHESTEGKVRALTRAAGFQGERLPCRVVSGRPSPHICFLSPLLLQMATDAVAQRSTGAGAQGPQGPEWVLPGWTKEFVPLSSGGVPCLPLPEAPPSTMWPPSCRKDLLRHWPTLSLPPDPHLTFTGTETPACTPWGWGGGRHSLLLG